MRNVSLRSIYVELSFWAATLAGVLGIVSSGLEGLTGINESVTVALAVGNGVLAFVAAALLRRGADLANSTNSE